MLVLFRSFTSSCFFFFKQKTAYEMRISDWSSDVCSSDLVGCIRRQPCFARSGCSAGGSSAALWACNDILPDKSPGGPRSDPPAGHQFRSSHACFYFSPVSTFLSILGAKEGRWGNQMRYSQNSHRGPGYGNFRCFPTTP